MEQSRKVSIKQVLQTGTVNPLYLVWFKERLLLHVCKGLRLTEALKRTLIMASQDDVIDLQALNLREDEATAQGTQAVRYLV